MSTTTTCDTAKCKRCGLRIFLVQVGPIGYKWLTQPKRRNTWHCGRDPLFPLQSHQP